MRNGGQSSQGAGRCPPKLISIVTVIGRGFKPDVEKNFLAEVRSRRLEPGHVGSIRMPGRVSAITISVTGFNRDAGGAVRGH